MDWPCWGAIFPALVNGDEFVSEGAWLLHFDRMPPHFLLPAINADGGSAVSRLVRAVREGLLDCPAKAAKPTLFLIFDAMVPNVASILEGIYLELSNRVEYAGVNAGSETFQPMPCLFDEARVIGDGVLGLLLPGGMAPVLAHGFAQPDQAMKPPATAVARLMTCSASSTESSTRRMRRTTFSALAMGRTDARRKD